MFAMNLHDLILEILKHYPCPQECHSQCCKVFDIPLNENDIKKLEKIQPNISKTLRLLPDGRKKFSKKNCQFLEKYRCSIYQDRPEACQRFPFTVKADTNPDKVTVRPCIVSIQILKDFAGYSNSLDQSGYDDIVKMFTEMDLTHIKDIKNVFFLKADMLQGFLEHLDCTEKC